MSSGKLMPNCDSPAAATFNESIADRGSCKSPVSGTLAAATLFPRAVRISLTPSLFARNVSPPAKSVETCNMFPAPDATPGLGSSQLDEEFWALPYNPLGRALAPAPDVEPVTEFIKA